MIGLGLTDKLYWRQARAGALTFHCFKRGSLKRRSRYVALCSDAITIANSGGQAIRRPPPVARCAGCDCAEMKRRGWSESGATSADWSEYL
ncbi:MAG TPA: hypothetical protein VFD36_20560 [Kofleriaceae bacterium]|nr:hypothetical protein [Kofleriaceae bacterium]